jgi:3-oxoacyl-(acyl-carrier-protein) synthase
VSRRVVVTGLGVIAANGNGVAEFELALRKGRSGLARQASMVEAGFGCQVAAVPQGVDALAQASFSEAELMAMNTSHRYAGLAALEAWQDAGLARPDARGERVHWDTGAVLGTGIGGMDTIAERVVPLVNEKKSKRLGSTAVEQVMASGISARVSGLLALGNQVTTNSSACATGVEAIAEGVWRIRAGRAERMLCGGAEVPSPYIWAGFDAMRVLCRKFNDEPEKASRPMSASAGGFIPGAGAGVLVVESLDAARARGARIRAEVLGVSTNCGGQRGGGSMTSPNPAGVQRCIRDALADARLDAARVDAISGHLTATGADPKEVASWAAALGRRPSDFPAITSTKSLIGHALGAAGAIEAVAAVLMLEGGFVHASRNCEDLHPEIAPYAAAVPHETRTLPGLSVMMKAGFGFGDVNAALVLRKWEPDNL